MANINVVETILFKEKIKKSLLQLMPGVMDVVSENESPKKRF